MKRKTDLYVKSAARGVQRQKQRTPFNTVPTAFKQYECVRPSAVCIRSNKMALVGPQEISHIVNGDETVLFTSGAVGTGYARVSAQCAFEEGSNEVTCTSIKLLYHCGQRLSGWMNLFDGKC